MDLTLQLLIGVVVGYVFGMLPTGVIVGKALGVDLTQTGQRPDCATNVLRTLGVKWAVVVAVGDILKGAVPGPWSWVGSLRARPGGVRRPGHRSQRRRLPCLATRSRR